MFSLNTLDQEFGVADPQKLLAERILLSFQSVTHADTLHCIIGIPGTPLVDRIAGFL